MPMLPSSSSARLPGAGAGHLVEDRADDRAARRRRAASATATGERSTPSANTPRRASAWRWRPGPQPTSSTGPLSAVEHRSSVVSAGPSQRASASGIAAVPQPHRAGAHRARAGARARRRRRERADRLDAPPAPARTRCAGAWRGDRPGVVDRVDVAERRLLVDAQSELRRGARAAQRSRPARSSGPPGTHRATARSSPTLQ